MDFNGSSMPQIVCPNCGKTINLENRKQIDFDLIHEAVKKKPRTFCELLNITKLPRKTLSLRLKDLCLGGALIKTNGAYVLNNSLEFETMHKPSLKRVSRIFDDRKLKIGLTLMMFLLSSSISGYVFAMFITSPLSNSPKPLGTATIAFGVNNVEDLYSWQVIIIFNSDQINILKVMPGEFFPVEDPLLLNATDIAKDVLLVGATLIGDVSGKSGSGVLAKISFEYFVEEYEMPHLALSEKGFCTHLLNSQGLIIPLDDTTTLTLTFEGE
jgi:hypothetical protein